MTPWGLPALSLRPQPLSPEMQTDFIRCINPVSRALKASLIADALSEPGPGGAFKNPQSLNRLESSN